MNLMNLMNPFEFFKKNGTMYFLAFFVQVVSFFFLIPIFESNFTTDFESFIVYVKSLTAPMELLFYPMQSNNNFIFILAHMYQLFDNEIFVRFVFLIVGFSASWAIFLAFKRFGFNLSPADFLIFNLLPSTLIWSSYPTKDVISLFAISIFVYSLSLIRTTLVSGGPVKNDFDYLISRASEISRVSERITLSLCIATLVIVSFTLLYLLRVWMLPIILAPSVIYLLLLSRVSDRKNTVRYLAYLGTFSASLFIYKMAQSLYLVSPDEILARINSVVNSWAVGGSALASIQFQNFAEVITFLPKGMIAALFRPFIFEVKNVWWAIAGIDNLIFLSAFVALAKSYTKDRKPEVAFVLLVAVSFALFYSFLSYQNLGTAQRFRYQIYPLILVPFLGVYRLKIWQWIRTLV